ncbi:hypothetical protein GWK08_14035 [Leptobacterium flavescens]|uniref:Uncharacterized protein n=1 Tax=Leptobacterium flavescens TaxID=472055 RepID=A0A6P0UQ22_9FLAO|nr:hypothetical protein [Leptobacterium flavescens]NER14570.1 hypothetical protein [Leptobacterium flavescens]
MAASKEKLVLIKEAELTNNCPVCYSNEDLVLLVHQKLIKNRFFIKVTRNLVKTIQCRKCSSVIYPVDWTDDIERVFDYYNKMVEPKKPSLRFTSFFYITTLTIIALAGTMFFLWYKEII